MPRSKSTVWDNFIEQRQRNKLYGKCRFCNKMYLSNATKMAQHLLKCNSCPNNVKTSILDSDKNKKKNKIGNANNSQFSSASISNIGIDGDNASASFSTSSASHITSFIDKMSVQDQNKLDEALGRALYSAMLPLRMVENKFVIHFMKMLRPSYVLPSRKKLSTALLEKEYEKVEKFVHSKVENAPSLTLLSDGWTDINGICLINIILATPEPIFLKSITSGVEKHTAEYISNLLSNEIDKIGILKVNGVVTDHARNMTAAWAKLREKYSHLITYGCVAHGLNLLAKDISSIPYISEIISNARIIVKYFNNKSLPKQVLLKVQAERDKNPISLKLPVETRWSSNAITLESLLKNKNNLQAACLDVNLINNVDQSVKRLVMDEPTFWCNTEKVFHLLKPIAIIINNIEGDKPTLGYVHAYLKDLDTQINEKCSVFSYNVKSKILECLHKRKEFLHHECHLAANFLNPRYHTGNMSETEVLTAMNFIVNMGKKLHINEEDVLLAELAEYKVKSSDWHPSKTPAWKVALKVNGGTWWKWFFKEKGICQIACRLLDMPATTGSCERNFKTHSNIKTKKRNRLTIERTKKLVFVKYNEDIMSQDDLETFILTETKTEEVTNGREALQNLNTEHDSDGQHEDLDDADEFSYDTDELVDDNTDGEVEDEDECEENTGTETLTEFEFSESALSGNLEIETTETSEKTQENEDNSLHTKNELNNNEETENSITTNILLPSGQRLIIFKNSFQTCIKKTN